MRYVFETHGACWTPRAIGISSRLALRSSTKSFLQTPFHECRTVAQLLLVNGLRMLGKNIGKLQPRSALEPRGS